MEIGSGGHQPTRCTAESNPDEMACVETGAARLRSEVRVSCWGEEKAKFQNAKAHEIESWIRTAAIQKITRQKIPSDRILCSRWILTWKKVDGESNHVPEYKPKARLVVRARPAARTGPSGQPGDV